MKGDKRTTIHIGHLSSLTKNNPKNNKTKQKQNKKHTTL